MRTRAAGEGSIEFVALGLPFRCRIIVSYLLVMPAAYAAAKRGVIVFTKSPALERDGFDIRVNARCPGVTLSKMTREHLGADAQRIEAAVMPLGSVAAERRQCFGPVRRRRPL